MIFSVYSFSIAFSIVFLLIVFELVRKSRIQERYSLLWILFGAVMLVLSSTPYFIERIAAIFEIRYAPSVLFLFGFVFLIIYSLNITVVFSKQSQNITRLNQEIALLKEKVERRSQDQDNC